MWSRDKRGSNLRKSIVRGGYLCGADVVKFVHVVGIGVVELWLPAHLASSRVSHRFKSRYLLHRFVIKSVIWMFWMNPHEISCTGEASNYDSGPCIFVILYLQ